MHLEQRLLLFVAAGLATCSALSAQEPDAAAFARVRNHVLPAVGEQAWRAIPWHDTLRQGLMVGHEQHRPVLLWAMNGHPLGCV